MSGERNPKSESEAKVAEDIAASVDEATFEAIEEELEGGSKTSKDARNILEDALEAAGMVDEGGPVVAPVTEEHTADGEGE